VAICGLETLAYATAPAAAGMGALLGVGEISKKGEIGMISREILGMYIYIFIHIYILSI